MTTYPALTGEGAQPNTYSSVPPQGKLNNNTIVFTIWGDNLQPEEVRSSIQSWLADVKKYLQWQSDTFSGFNDALEREARQSIESADQNCFGIKTS
jgi:hypothetical protein